MFFKRQPPLGEWLPELRQWFETDLGQQLLLSERDLLDRLLPTMFGYHLLQISVDNRLDLARESPVRHQIKVNPVTELGLPDSAVISRNEELPFAHNSVDVVVLHHALDFAQSPHQVLREAARVLRPGGFLLNVGFNPISWWGLYRKLKFNQESVPWQGHFISSQRMHDWLSLLELTVVKELSDYYCLPFEKQSWRQRARLIDAMTQRCSSSCGAFMLQVARKDIGGMTPVEPVSKKRKLINLPRVEPSTRGARGSVSEEKN
ncbi:class I SAM-dependent methyltransferase [Amphritea sp. 1_MG-2023]|uniref:class I SAM-dependent methyltransferase n=1 Tax=Amphritea sp. 1_MG-2023 TaxID=3062670 RepID=UPI0026E1B265|nr:class I SAM-dependent methyltransferase [Amphritea sp. 1_MG-2023]MDO6562516.1 class I SAM-dependent methyltransferase [Amphritea sp. 1_MG-2023]